MIDITVSATAAFRSNSKRRRFTMPYANGMTGMDILSEEFDRDSIRTLILMINSRNVPKNSAISEGDSVYILSTMGGG